MILWRTLANAWAKLLTGLLIAAVAILILPVSLQVFSRFTDLLPNFMTATVLAFVVVAAELAVITWIRSKYMDSPPLSAALQVGLGGALVFASGVLIGSG